jgi:hypothetical protein
VARWEAGDQRGIVDAHHRADLGTAPRRPQGRATPQLDGKGGGRLTALSGRTRQKAGQQRAPPVGCPGAPARRGESLDYGWITMQVRVWATEPTSVSISTYALSIR